MISKGLAFASSCEFGRGVFSAVGDQFQACGWSLSCWVSCELAHYGPWCPQDINAFSIFIMRLCTKAPALLFPLQTDSLQCLPSDTPVEAMQRFGMAVLTNTHLRCVASLFLWSLCLCESRGLAPVFSLSPQAKALWISAPRRIHLYQTRSGWIFWRKRPQLSSAMKIILCFQSKMYLCKKFVIDLQT